MFTGFCSLEAINTEMATDKQIRDFLISGESDSKTISFKKRGLTGSRNLITHQVGRGMTPQDVVTPADQAAAQTQSRVAEISKHRDLVKKKTTKKKRSASRSSQRKKRSTSKQRGKTSAKRRCLPVKRKIKKKKNKVKKKRNQKKRSKGKRKATLKPRSSTVNRSDVFTRSLQK